VVSKPQQPLLPPSAPVLPVWEPIAHRTRSRASAPLALFASGGWFHECVQFPILTAKSLHTPPVAMGFAGLCAMHHMMTVETTHFAALYSALSHKDNPVTLSVLDPTTGNMLEHCQLQREDPWYKTTWDTLYANELGRLCQRIGSGKPPHSKHVAGTNMFFRINYHDIPLHKRKETCHIMVVYKVYTDKDNHTTHKSPFVAIASVTLAMWVLTQRPLNCSSSFSTVYSLKKVHALAPLTLRTSTLTHPCPSLNMFTSKSQTSQMSSSTNTHSQVWTVMDGFTSKFAKGAMACPKQAS
jgi:hypothetical protein